MDDYQNMKVAVLATMSVAGMEGGAERFYSGLVEALNKAGADAELVSLPVDESSFDGIVSAYAAWQEHDLSRFDAVISTKAPSFVVSHPRHVLYLLHTMRVFYDMFETSFPQADAELVEQRDTIRSWDSQAINRIPVRFTIGQEVSNRLTEFNGIESEVLHPPLLKDIFREGESTNFFFMPGRLHRWKRVDLAIKAIKNSTVDTRLLIAGEGEDESDLRELAGDDKRIVFLGRISDEELSRYYSEATAVVFVPVREDYGYITLEAFKSAKPVITCTDSGEPARLVQSGLSGYVVEPQPGFILEAVESILQDPAAAVKMGRAGKASIEHITWDKVADSLLKAALSIPAQRAGPDLARTNRVAVLDMQPIDPAIGGGRLRLLGLYHALGENFETRYVGSYDWPGESYRKQQLSETLSEEVVPLSDQHHRESEALSRACGGKTVIDIAFSQQGELSQEYLAAAAAAVEWADIVVFSHPWVFALVEPQLGADKFVVYDSHNVEGYLRAQFLDRKNPRERDLLFNLVENENLCGMRSDLVLCCSSEDQAMFSRLYNWPPAKCRVVPNGVMSKKILPAHSAEKTQARQRLGIGDEAFVAFFIGSSYSPNLEAAEFIIKKLAPRMKDVIFVIAGGVTDKLTADRGANLVFAGSIDDDEKSAWLHASDIAINPMFSGSGTNIKMFDFMTAGLPVVTTTKGARGIVVQQQNGFLTADESADSFAGEIARLKEDPDLRDRLSRLGRECVERHYSWEKISPALGMLLQSEDQPSTIAGPAGQRRHIGIFTTWNIHCGIAEESFKYARGIRQAGQQVSVFGNTLRNEFCTDVAREMLFPLDRVWLWDNQHWTDSAVDIEALSLGIHQSSIDTLLIQHHYAYLPDSAYCEIAALAKKQKLKVIVEIHHLKQLLDGGSSLIRQDAIDFIVHSSLDYEALVSARGDKGVWLMPLPLEYRPVTDAEPRLQGAASRDSEIVLSGFGYLRPHKGVKDAISCVAALRQRFPKISYRGFHAIYDADSRDYYQECLEHADQLGVGSAVDITTEFLPGEVIHRRLSDTDIILMPYGDSDEGGSAAVNMALSTGVPVVISESNIFSEVRHLCLKVDIWRENALQEACESLLDDQALRERMGREIDQWLSEHNLGTAITRLLSI